MLFVLFYSNVHVAMLWRFACEEPVRLHVVPLLTYPEGLLPCPISAEVDDPVSNNFTFYYEYADTWNMHALSPVSEAGYWLNSTEN